MERIKIFARRKVKIIKKIIQVKSSTAEKEIKQVLYILKERKIIHKEVINFVNAAKSIEKGENKQKQSETSK